MISNANLFNILKSKDDPRVQRKFIMLPKLYGDCFGKRNTHLKVPAVIREMPMIFSVTVFTQARNYYLIVDSMNYQRSDRQFTIDSTNVNSDDDDDDDDEVMMK